ncbi:uncharacterized protein LOC114355180 [Ostrinia furnacalis]|uniref:uncharacterized protein LOC114355180 n=1 Tax=Ostrinia furnacalis TaxID=93504 RepID=UPI00103F8096|nr:uncharacterized protein LOC114355180 [Ostrinia furnacalis]
MQNIETVFETTKRLCNQTRIIEIDAECRNSLQPLAAQLQEMKREYASISHLVDNRTKRSAWIGGIGTLLKQIFGSLDEDDGLRYDEAIASLQNNEKKLASLMKENILITSSTLKYYNNTLHKIKSNEASLAEAIDKLSTNIKNITEITNGLQIRASVNEILSILETSILTLSFQLEDITNAILFSSQNILHPAIITPSQLHQELADNYRHLPGDLELPVTLDINSVYLIFNISKLVCYYFKDKIIFVLQVPLVNTKEYVLFHTIALPTPYEPKEPNSFSLIIPDHKYIAMTKDKSHYCTFDNLKICKSVGSEDFVCNIENLYSTEARTTCQSELLAKVINKKPVQCESKIIFGKLDIWKPLSNNKWIFIQSEPNKISIDCHNAELYETSIIGTGLVSIPKDCIGYCKSTTLIPKYNVLNITSPINHVPDFNLINDTCCNINKLNDVRDNVSPIHLHDIDLDDFNSENKNKIKSLLDDLKSIEHPPNPHIVKYGTHYSIIIILMFIAIIATLCYCTTKRLFCKSGSNRPFKFKINLNRPSSQTPPETIDSTDRQDPNNFDIEMTSPVAPLRTKI